MVASVASANFLAEQRPLHRKLGCVVIGLLAFRLIWGVIGGKHARFTDLVPGPRAFFGYVFDMIKRQEARYLGHNPAGGAMIMALLVTLSAVGGTGY